MKKSILVFSLVLIVALCACGKKDMGSASGDNGGAVSPENSGHGSLAEKVTESYEDDMISFDVPKSWQKNFKSVTREAGSSGNTYMKTDFYYTVGEQDIMVMSVGRFTNEQWEALKKSEKGAEAAKLGESKDKKYVYTVFFEKHDYIEDRDLLGKLSSVSEEAQAIRDKINVK